jgi:hypothetical protein
VNTHGPVAENLPPYEWAAAAKGLALDLLAARTADLFSAAGIPNLLIKGPATTRLLYPGEPGRRRYTDVDVLVPVAQFAEAQDVLNASGYRWMLQGVRDGEFPWYETAWRGPGPNGLAIDLHRSFSGVSDPIAFFDGVWESREQFELSGSTLWVPGAGATALIIALHAANPGRGRKPLTDILRTPEVFGLSVWRDAASLARVCGAESAMRAGLDLLPDGAQLADDLGLGGSVTPDKWLAGRQHNRVSVNLAIALSEPGFGKKIQRVVKRVLPSPAFVRLWDVSARRGPGWLAFGYVRRVAITTAAGPRAIVDVVAASRAVRRTAKAGSRAGTRRKLKSAREFIQRLDHASLRTALWSLRTHRNCRYQLRRNGLNDIEVSAPPSARPKDRRVSQAVLNACGASCLERSVVLQRFDAAAGQPRAVVIGVTGPGNGFRAHAWLDGDVQPDTELREITRVVAPAKWCT